MSWVIAILILVLVFFGVEIRNISNKLDSATSRVADLEHFLDNETVPPEVVVATLDTEVVPALIPNP